MKKFIPWLVIFIVIIGLFIYFNKAKNVTLNQNNNVATTTEEDQEQKLIALVTKDWNATSSDNFTFKYPRDFGTQYIHPVDWPPILNLENQTYQCLVAGDSKVLPAGMTKVVNINGHEYCLTLEEEGAAGSTYTNYAYAFSYQNKTLILTFTTRQPQCMNYDNPQQKECLKEENTFQINPIVDTMVQTLKN